MPHKSQEKRRQLARDYYARNREAVYSRNRRWQKRNLDKVHTYRRRTHVNLIARRMAMINRLKEQPCFDCGQKFPHYIMEFDHARGEKVDNIAGLIYRSLKKLTEELAKCDLVCANCHCARTWFRKNPGLSKPTPTTQAS